MLFHPGALAGSHCESCGDGFWKIDEKGAKSVQSAPQNHTLLPAGCAAAQMNFLRDPLHLKLPEKITRHATSHHALLENDTTARKGSVTFGFLQLKHTFQFQVPALHSKLHSAPPASALGRVPHRHYPHRRSRTRRSLHLLPECPVPKLLR